MIPIGKFIITQSLSYNLDLKNLYLSIGQNNRYIFVKILYTNNKDNHQTMLPKARIKEMLNGDDYWSIDII